MNIEFVNHSSFIVSHNNISLIIDPWIEGTAFYDGWALIAPTAFTYNNFEHVTHIWFSHEHPDHFSPANIKAIPPHIRQNITVLYQKTADRKVVDFCKNVGFKQVVELDAKWHTLAPGFDIYNKPHTDGDSWLAIKAGGKTLLNVNDCVFDTPAELQKVKKVCGNIDVLFTQFSYAQWVGNINNEAQHIKQAKRKVEEIKRQVEILKPEYIIPFASFVWFCHADNFYLNKCINRIDYIYHILTSQTQAIPVILYPGDAWQPGTTHNSAPALKRWTEQYNNQIKHENALQNHVVSKDELIVNAKKFASILAAKNPVFIKLLKPTTIYVTCWQQAYTFSIKNGLVNSSKSYDDCDIALSADMLNYTFKHLWGGSTMRVNGRYQLPANGKFFNVKMYYQIAQLNNFNQSFNFWYIAGIALTKLKAKLVGS